MKFLEKLDIVGYQPVLTIFKNDRFKTKLGIVVGFCTIFSILGIGLYFFVNFILRTELNVIYNQTTEQKSRIDFSSSPIIISLSNGMLEPIKDDFHEIRVNFWNWTRHNSNDTFFSLKTPEIDLEPCDSSRHFGNFAGLLETIPFYPKMKCFTRNFDYSLIGKYGDALHPGTFINIAVNMCNNITTGGKCPSKEVLRPILENTYLSVFYIEYEISHDNFYEPLKPVLKTIIVPINWDIHTRYFNSIKRITHTTDTGFLFEDKVRKYGYSESTMLPISQIRQGSTLYPDLTIGTFTIIGSAMSDNYFRVYLKGQVLLAQIGGITNTILMIGKLICYIVTKNMFIIDINNLLEIDFVEILSKDKNEFNSKNQTQCFNKSSQINSTPIFNNSNQISEIPILNNSTHININPAVHNSSKIKLNSSQLSLKKKYKPIEF